MSYETIIIGAVIAAAALYFGIGELQRRREEAHLRWREYDVPEPETKRTDILYGSFGCYGDTASLDFTSLIWCVPHWEGLEKTIIDIRTAARTTVLDLQHALFERLPGSKVMTPLIEAAQETNLRTLFDRLRDEGVLGFVKVLSPVDEPNLPETAVDDYIPAAIALVRRVASEYAELADVKIGVIFYADRPMQHVELYDVLGFDDYDSRSGILRPGELYDQLVERLRPDQRTWLVPGGSYGQDPTPFINFAHSRPEVWAVIPFIWFVPPWEKFKGIRDIPEMRDAYSAAGRRLLAQQGGV